MLQTALVAAAATIVAVTVVRSWRAPAVAAVEELAEEAKTWLDSSDVQTVRRQLTAVEALAPNSSFYIRAWGTPVMEIPLWELGPTDPLVAWPKDYASTEALLQPVIASVLAAHSRMWEDSIELTQVVDDSGAFDCARLDDLRTMPLLFRHWQHQARAWDPCTGGWGARLMATGSSECRADGNGSWGGSDEKQWSLEQVQEGVAAIERAVMKATDTLLRVSGLPTAFAGVKRSHWPRIRWWAEVHGNCSTANEPDRLPGMVTGSVILHMPRNGAKVMLVDPRSPHTPFEPEGPSYRPLAGVVMVHPAYLPRETLPTVGAEARVSLEFVVDAGRDERLEGRERPEGARAVSMDAPRDLSVPVRASEAEDEDDEESGRKPVGAIGMSRLETAKDQVFLDDATGSRSPLRNEDIFRISAVMPRSMVSPLTTSVDAALLDSLDYGEYGEDESGLIEALDELEE
jgi:hypothetical protein